MTLGLYLIGSLHSIQQVKDEDETEDEEEGFAAYVMQKVRVPFSSIH